MTENEIQRQIFEWLVLQGYLVMRINSGRMHSIPFARWQVLGLPVQSSGISDLLALDWDGQIYVIEAKQPGEKPTEQQKLFMAEAKRRGAVCIVADSLESIQRQMGARI
jgi:hypothetical protein